MKTQIKFQKILSLATLIVGALVFVYALCFFSGNLADLLFYKNDALVTNTFKTAKEFYGADNFITAGQNFNSILIVLGIVYIIAGVILYVTSTNSRRKYYITNYVAIGIVIAVAATVAFFCIIYVSILIGEFANVDFETIEVIRTAMWPDGVTPRVPNAPEVGQSHLMFILGYVLAVIVIINAVFWALNLVWKIKLMKGERELLEKGPAKEAA